MTKEEEIERRIDKMWETAHVNGLCKMLRRAVQIIQSAADAGNVQCKHGIIELAALCPPLRKSTKPSDSATSDKS